MINIRDENLNKFPTGDSGSQSGQGADFGGNGPPETRDSNPVPLPPRRRLRQNLLLLLFIGGALYFFLPRWAVMQQALAVLSHLSIPFVALAVAAQVLSYLGSGYLLRSVVRASPRPISVLHGALVTLAANSIGTLGGGAPGTAAMTYLWLRRHGVNRGAAGLGGWIPIFLNLGGLAAGSRQNSGRVKPGMRSCLSHPAVRSCIRIG